LHKSGTRRAADPSAKLLHMPNPLCSMFTVRSNLTCELGANIPYCEETKYRIGLGVEGQVNGYYLHVGNERFMRQSSINVRAAETDRHAGR
jgi:hypothetical protein